MRCLVVDDNPDDRALVERLLQHWGYRATCVASGKAAITLASQEQFDIAIVDLGMPGLSGVQTLRALRERDSRLRLLVVTGFQDKAHVIEALDAGANGYLMKDELGERLGKAIQEVFAGQSPLSARACNHILRYIATLRSPPPEEPRMTVVKKKMADASGEIEVAKVDLPRGES